MSSVWDASAILAVVRGEARASEVVDMLDGALISSVNVCEVIYKFVASGGTLESAQWIIGKLPIVSVPFTDEQAAVAASIHKSTHRKGISFADRACLALGLSRDLKVITSDSRWLELDLDVDIHLFHGPSATLA